jgi:hypothetical protein
MIAKRVCNREQEMATRFPAHTPSCRTHRDTVVCADVPMNRVILVIALALLSSACMHLPPLPQPSAPAPSARVDAPPGTREATFSILLAAPLSELEALLRDQLTLPSAPDWQLVTEPGKSPEVEVRYEAELLAPRIALSGQTLTLKLQVAYFGALRARVHTPFGWVRLSKGTQWGDAERRGIIEVTIQSVIEVGPDYRLHAQSLLQDVKLSAPPIDQLCAGGAFKICIPAEVAARPIHAELERRIRARVEPGLARVDEQVSERASLARVAERMWQHLFSATGALASGEHLRFGAHALMLSYPFLLGDQLAVVLSISAAPVFDNQPAAPATELPPLVVAAPGATFVPLGWLEPFVAINAGLSSAVRLLPRTDEQTPTEIRLLGPAPSESRFLVALGLERAGQKRTVYAECALSFAEDSLKLDALTLSDESERLLALAKIDRATFLAAAGRASYRPRAALDARVRSLRALIADGLSPLPIDPLPNVQARIVSARAAQGGILLEAELH